MKIRLLIVIAVVVALSILVLVPSHHAQTQKKLDLSVIYLQEGAPVELVTVTSDLDYLFSKAVVKSVSDRRINGITLGVFMHELNLPQPGILVAKHEIPTDLKPKASVSLDTFGASIKKARQSAIETKYDPVVLDFGVLEVEFEDGGSWQSVALNNKAFPPQAQRVVSSAKAQGNAGSVVCGRSTVFAWLDSIMPTVFAQVGYQCNGSSVNEICTVGPSGTTCSMTGCTKDQILKHQCSDQKCEHIP